MNSPEPGAGFALATTTSGSVRHVLESPRPFRSSMLWALQRRYFSERGVAAWRDEEVPHYITSNPVIASAYAETVFAFYQDRQRLAGASPQPLTICELGAGSGRFAFHFLRSLLALCAASGVAPTAFRYILTDFTQTNLDAWRGHARFQPWFDSGLLELALFDVVDAAAGGDRLLLQESGQQLGPGSLEQPLVVLANYVFDGVPQDLYHFNHGVVDACQVALLVDDAAGAVQADAATLLAQLHLQYSLHRLDAAPCGDASLQYLFGQYRDTVARGHLLFPAASLQALQRLRALSSAGLLLLSADKGQCTPDAVVQQAPPTLARHGSFSLSVNYHALLQWARNQGGLALQPSHQHRSLAVIGLLLVADADRHDATRYSYARWLAGFSPDDFYTVVSFMRRAVGEMEISDIMAYLRLGRDDGHQLLRVLPRLHALAPTLDPRYHADLLAQLERCWDNYFPLGEEQDLAFEIAGLLYELDDFEGALRYFDQTEQWYGSNPGVRYNMAACLQQLGRDDEARALLEQVLEVMPDNEGARVLLAQLQIGN